MAVGAPLAAQTIVTSSGPSAVSVTMYRNPHRDADAGSQMDLDELNGFALITETREVELPPGAVTIRFEGVASGIEPVSSIVFGVPVDEKNRDRRLLSQRGLLDAFTGQSVIIRRTDKATGNVTDEPGTIRSAPDSLILQTKGGFESIYCTGLDQTLLFPHVPADLTAKPTLSVTTHDQPGGKQTITLSYLAGHFDWQANYVGELSEDTRHVDLLAWLTMASGDQTSFVDANAFAVAGKLSRVERDEEKDVQAEEEVNPYGADDIDISYQCWPSGTTSSGSVYGSKLPPLPSSSAPALMMMRSGYYDYDLGLDEIIVTANRRAEREDLGDLKLYRIPFPVTVAAHSQKQVAFLSKLNVSGEMIYRSRFAGGDDNSDVDMLYRIQNTEKSGLGEAIPSGQVTLFQTVGGRRMLVGEIQLADKAVGEEVELVLAQANNVSVNIDDTDEWGDDWDGYVLTVSNANPFPVTYEAEFQNNDEDMRYEKFSARLFERKGKQVWRVTIPANGERKLGFREVDISQ